MKELIIRWIKEDPADKYLHLAARVHSVIIRCHNQVLKLHSASSTQRETRLELKCKCYIYRVFCHKQLSASTTQRETRLELKCKCYIYRVFCRIQHLLKLERKLLILKETFWNTLSRDVVPSVLCVHMHLFTSN